MIEIPGKGLEFTLIDLQSVLSEELPVISSHLESVFPHLGIVPRPKHCSIYSHDLLFHAVSAEHYRDILKRSSQYLGQKYQAKLV